MRYFALLNFQHLMAVIFPTMLFIVVFGVALAFSHFHGKDDAARQQTITGHFAEGIEDRNAPFPLFMILIIVGVLIWGFFYIVMNGILGVKIS
jgi:hypothetical protein